MRDPELLEIYLELTRDTRNAADDAVLLARLAELAREGFDPVFGARPLKRSIQQLHQRPLDIFLLHDIHRRAHFSPHSLITQKAQARAGQKPGRTGRKQQHSRHRQFQNPCLIPGKSSSQKQPCRISAVITDGLFVFTQNSGVEIIQRAGIHQVVFIQPAAPVIFEVLRRALSIVSGVSQPDCQAR